MLGPRILIIDDEAQIRRLLTVTLEAHGYRTDQAATGDEGLRLTEALRPDLIILDLSLPDIRGTMVLEQIRAWSKVPVVILTVHDDESEKVFALDHGADDYITKPFSMGELMARVRVALRHVAESPEDPIMRVGTLKIDLVHRVVERAGQPIKLTPIEYDLLRVLTLNAGRVMTHRQLLHQVWGEESYETESHYLRIYVGHLRKKIEDDPTRPRLIITEPGVGYRLLAPDSLDQ